MSMSDIAMELRGQFDARAAELDRNGGFPDENYARMREAGYLRGPVPAELGGGDADLEEAARAQRALGWGCASTALAVNMHLFQVGGAADGYRGAGANEAPLRRVADEGIILGSTGAEAIAAGAWSTPTTAVPDGDEYVINGHKYFCSQASAMNVVRVNAMDSESGEVLIVAIPASLPGVEVIETWDALGMRGTASHDVTFDNVRVPAAAVGPRLPADGPAWDPRFANVVKWFQSLMTGVYVGIGDRAHEEALASARGATGNAARDQALTEALVGQLEMAHCGMGAAFDFGLRQIALAPDPVSAMIVAIIMRDLATAAAVEVVDLAVQVTGGRAFFKKSVLERLARDVRAARHHPPSAPVSQQMVGKYMMGLGA